MSLEPIIALASDEMTTFRYLAGGLALVGALIAWGKESSSGSVGLPRAARPGGGARGTPGFRAWYLLLVLAGPLGWLLLAWLYLRSRRGGAAAPVKAGRAGGGNSFRLRFAWLGLVFYGALIAWLWWVMDHPSAPLGYAENRGRLHLDLAVALVALPVSASVEFFNERFPELLMEHGIIVWYAAPPLFGLLCGLWLDTAFFAGRKGKAGLKVGMVAALLMALIGLSRAERARQAGGSATVAAAGAFMEAVLSRVSGDPAETVRLADQWIFQRHLSGILGEGAAASVFGEIAEMNGAADSLIAIAPSPFTAASFFERYPTVDRDPDSLDLAEEEFALIRSRWDELAARIAAAGGEVPWDHGIPGALEAIGSRLAALRVIADSPPPEEEAPLPFEIPAPAELTGNENGAIGFLVGKQDGFVISREAVERGKQVLKADLSDTAAVNAFLRRGWDELGMRVDSVSGSAAGWAVLMSEQTAHGGGMEQQVLYDMDQTAIAEGFDQGMKITALDGHRDRWMVVLSRVAAYGEQRFTTPTPFDDARLDWLKKRVSEGFLLTAVGGMDDPEIADDGWIFVVTKGLPAKDQIVLGPGDWPAATLAKRATEGYRVTAAAGGPGRWLLVITLTEGAAQEFENVAR